MLTIDSNLDAAARLAIAALVGIGVGLERERSGHATGPHARFAGLRTFLLLGLLGGAAGLMAVDGAPAAAAAVAAGGVGLAVAAYAMATRQPDADPDGTTEAAALVVVAIGLLAGLGRLTLAAGAGSLVVLVLSEKTRLHGLVRRIGEPELRAALQFAVLALVVLPLLPEGPYLGFLAVHPRDLWSVVLLLSGLNYLGYLATRVAGSGRGHAITGLIGGLVSSTLVTIGHSRQSRTKGEERDHPALATGVIAACTVLFPRVILVCSALNTEVASGLTRALLVPMLVGAVMVAFLWRTASGTGRADEPAAANPLRLGAAIRLALLFQVAIVAMGIVRSTWGTSGLYATSALLGVSDVDALTVALSRADSGIVASDAARGIVVGIVANTVLKLGAVLGLGTGEFRRRAAAGLVILGVATIAGLWLA